MTSWLSRLVCTKDTKTNKICGVSETKRNVENRLKQQSPVVETSASAI